MTDFPFDCVGFDLDGTLVDSAADLAAAANHALVSGGLDPLPMETLRAMIGGGARHLLQSALDAVDSDADVDRLLPALLDYYDAHMTDRTLPFPGVIATLDALAARGVALAVVTNKRERFTYKLLDALGLTGRFACIVGGDTIPGKAKPDPAPIALMIERCAAHRAAFVGDSIYDVAAARAAGIPVLVFAPEGGESLGADAAFTDFGELPAILGFQVRRA